MSMTEVQFEEMFPKREHPEVEEKIEALSEMTADELLLRSFSEDIDKLWRCEDRIKPLLTAFIECMGENYLPRSAKKRRSLEASARDFIEECGADVGMIRWACKHMISQKLKVSDLRSLVFLAPDWRQMGRTEDRSRYLRGIDDE